MNIVIRRMKTKAGVCLGVLEVDGSPNCLTLERGEVEIPAGTYPVTLTQSDHLGRLLPLLHNVPGRTAIRIHSVNKSEELEGCVGVGLKRTSDEVGFEFPARPAEDHLVALIQTAISQGKAVSVSVEESEQSTSHTTGNIESPPETRPGKSLLQVILSLLTPFLRR